MNRHWANKGMLACALLFALIACADSNAVRVQLDARHHPGNEPGELDVQAQVTGLQSGLRYKWYSGRGEFDPQESISPKTSYYFGPNSARDRIWVEVWRENERVAEARIDVAADASGKTADASRPSNLQIAMTNIPRYDPAGGPDTRADIAGKITGPVSKEYGVVVYARADAWYIQPVPFALLPIQADGTWKSWTHTGSDYAALLVRSDYKPPTRLDALPPVEGDVFARIIVEGKKQ